VVPVRGQRADPKEAVHQGNALIKISSIAGHNLHRSTQNPELGIPCILASWELELNSLHYKKFLYKSDMKKISITCEHNFKSPIT
jgi:hypothetical protein